MREQLDVVVTADGLADSSDDMWLGHTKRNSRTQVYSGRKVHYLTGLLNVFSVSSFCIFFCFDNCMLFLCIHQARLAGWGIMFLTCPFVLPSICLSVATLVNAIFWKRVNQLWCKLAQVICRAMAWNLQLLLVYRRPPVTSSTGGQRPRSLATGVCHKKSLSARTVWQTSTRPNRHMYITVNTHYVTTTWIQKIKGQGHTRPR